MKRLDISDCCTLHNICEMHGDTFDESLLEGVENDCHRCRIITFIEWRKHSTSTYGILSTTLYVDYMYPRTSSSYIMLSYKTMVMKHYRAKPSALAPTTAQYMYSTTARIISQEVKQNIIQWALNRINAHAYACTNRSQTTRSKQAS